MTRLRCSKSLSTIFKCARTSARRESRLRRGLKHVLSAYDSKPFRLLVDSNEDFDFDHPLTVQIMNVLKREVRGEATSLSNSSDSSEAGAGTPDYLAPEHFWRSTAQGSTYGHGTIMYEMLVGIPPFNAPTVSRSLRTFRRNCTWEFDVVSLSSPRLQRLLEAMLVVDTRTAAM